MKEREIIIKHYTNPINRLKKEEEGYRHVEANNSSCVDHIDLYVKIENDTIVDLTFFGEACAIAISSSSLMIENLLGKTIQEAEEYIYEFFNMLSQKPFKKEVLKDAGAYANIVPNTHRVTCAALPLEALKKALSPEK